MSDEIEIPLAEIAFEALDWFREQFQLSHTGTAEGRDGRVVIWGLRHPAPDLHYFDLPSNTFDPIDRKRWEELTDMHPPFPWNEEGTGIVYTTEEPWWKSMMNP